MALVGHGVDLVEVARIARMLDEHGERFLARCFTQAEADYAASSARRVEHLAARFAAKEAVLKALGTGLVAGVSWTDIEVVRDDAGKPVLALTGQAARLAERLGARRWHLSLSHTSTHAIASAIATDEGYF